MEKKSPKPTVWKGSELLEGDELKSALEQGANPNRKNAKGWPPIKLACPDEIMLLLDHGAHPDGLPPKTGRYKDAMQMTPLNFWAQEDQKELCERLIDAGADIEARCYGQQTPLHRAVLNGSGNKDVVELLIMRGANVKAFDRNGHTPVTNAQYERSPEFAQFMLDTRARYEAEQSKRALLEGLDKPFIPADQSQAATERKRLM